ncbi:lysine-specific demethylase JMJ705-like isoform X2 [Tasmannia lanceolata]|uniref:lysine-specific demethylase JMJ705-like isoform X2 n=1 Tax=Tasmannia lanceolata TaxID=3420 RepID=UPI004063EC0D
MATDPPLEILPWLKSLPLAPEYHPNLTEFQDPISYILKIEKEASKFGICKIVPPLPSPPQKTTISNLNLSLSSRNPNPNPKKLPTFTTRQQQIGFCPRKTRPVQKPVWQSGETYTLPQFESKAKHFEKTQLKKTGKKALTTLEIETLFWNASVDKPFSVEYANDMPGSAFGNKWGEVGEAKTVGESAWNMRGVSRAKGSLLRFMKEEIPGVTSPMLYIAMLFSWFAWHVEDHELHSLNYLHLGAAKTWYGVPRDAVVAFEEVVRVHGYGGEVNPLVTFATLGEKTTVMSPEVLIGAGIPCCRLVQNAGEFVVTFPGAYHSGFSHGFNCGEAANIATPEWLRVAKEAAIRRASINYPPMVSHFQLLYALALTLCSRIPASVSTEPRSSRLKDKKRGEGEMTVKKLFVQNIIQNNDLLHILLEKGSSCVVLPQNCLGVSLGTSSRVGSQIKVKPRLSLGLSIPEEAQESSNILLSNDIVVDRHAFFRSVSLCQEKAISSMKCSQYSQCGSSDLYTSYSDPENMDSEKIGRIQGDGLLDKGLLSCVTCGILSFACVAVIQPREAAIRYIMSADPSFFNDQNVGSGVNIDTFNAAGEKTNNSDLGFSSGHMEKDDKDGLIDVPVQSSDFQIQVANQRVELVSDTVSHQGISSLDLLACAYGDSSDSEEEAVQPEMSPCADENDFIYHPSACNQDQQLRSGCTGISDMHELPSVNVEYRDQQILDFALGNDMGHPVSVEAHSSEGTDRNMATKSGSILTSVEVSCSKRIDCKESDRMYHTFVETSKVHRCDVKMDHPKFDSMDFSMLSEPPCYISDNAAIEKCPETTQFGNIDASRKNPNISFMQRSDKDSSRMHIFCLEHAMEVEKQLRPLGGVHMLLLCHPDYPKFEGHAKSLAEELGISYWWNEIPFREATVDDKENIRSAVDAEEAIPSNGDWAVKLGINLYYSSNLSKPPLYSRQMAYNSVLYKAFGRSTPGNSPIKPKVFGKRFAKQKKIVVAGKWCGKVWMSNQVHSYLAHRDTQEQEQIKEFHPQDTKQKLNAWNSVPSIKTVPRKSGKRRKQFEEVGTKKPKCHQPENAFLEENSHENASPQRGRSLRSGFVHGTPLRSDSSKNMGVSDSNLKDEIEGGPSTRLRRRPQKPEVNKVKIVGERQMRKKKVNRAPSTSDMVIKDSEAEYQCNMDGCSMGFSTKQELILHKRNICSIDGCGKKFFSHKYLVQHRRVHIDDRPLKCPWKGCKMAFKWAWARTEHIRVHTGVRPYVCREAGCGQTFRFVSDFSRHKRKTGHSGRNRVDDNLRPKHNFCFSSEGCKL